MPALPDVDSMWSPMRLPRVILLESLKKLDDAASLWKSESESDDTLRSEKEAKWKPMLLCWASASSSSSTRGACNQVRAAVTSLSRLGLVVCATTQDLSPKGQPIPAFGLREPVPGSLGNLNAAMTGVGLEHSIAVTSNHQLCSHHQ
jgi:hypothetical protein